MLQASGAHYLGSEPALIVPGRWRRNGGGDGYITDGQIKEYALSAARC